VPTCSPHASLAVPTQFAGDAQLAEGQICTGSIKHNVKRLDTGWTIRCSIPGSGKIFSLLTKVHTTPGSHPVSSSVGDGALFLTGISTGVKF